MSAADFSLRAPRHGTGYRIRAALAPGSESGDLELLQPRPAALLFPGLELAPQRFPGRDHDIARPDALRTGRFGPQGGSRPAMTATASCRTVRTARRSACARASRASFS